MTCRNQLPALLPADGAAVPRSLGPLTDDESVELLARRIGRSRVEWASEATAAIADACCGLPLALCVVAGRAAYSALLCPLSLIAEELSSATTRLSALVGGDPSFDVRTALS
ncbi:hypothetical protein ACWCPM_34135 [Streptomyces sp. NPDC002309]